MLKKIILYRGTSNKKAETLARKIIKWCDLVKIKCNTASTPSEIPEFLPSDLIISMGGDGTFLSLSRAESLLLSETPVIGVNLGRLGFLAETDPCEILSILKTFHESRRKIRSWIEKRGMLDIILPDGKILRALNDCVIKTAETGKTATITVCVENEYLADYTGDGLIFATPTGSTAYSLSAGGPIIHPHTDAILITPIATHTLSQRPLIISTSHTLQIKRATLGEKEKISVFADGQIVLENLTSILKIRPSKLKFPLVKNPSKRYFGILREKLGWGKR